MPEQQSTGQPDMLRAIFELQCALNDHVFSSNGLKNDDGHALRMEHVAAAAERGQGMVNDLPNRP